MDTLRASVSRPSADMCPFWALPPSHTSFFHYIKNRFLSRGTSRKLTAHSEWAIPGESDGGNVYKGVVGHRKQQRVMQPPWAREARVG